MKLYPVDASNADEWLAEEIFRAACDPGALAVFRCFDRSFFSMRCEARFAQAACIVQAHAVPLLSIEMHMHDPWLPRVPELAAGMRHASVALQERVLSAQATAAEPPGERSVPGEGDGAAGRKGPPE